MNGPVLVTHHGRPRSVLISAEAYEKMGDGSSAVSAGFDCEMVIDHMAEGLLIFDDALQVLRVNRAGADYFSRSPSAMTGTGLADLFHSLHETVVARILSRVLRTGEATSFEAPSAAHSGQQLKFDAFPFDDGVACLFQAVRDEESRHQAAENEALKALFVAHGAAGTARLSARGTFTSIDAPLLAMVGFAKQDLISARLIDIVPVARRVELREALEAVLNGKGATAIATELMTRGGPELPVTIALAETREAFAIDGAIALITPRMTDDPGA